MLEKLTYNQDAEIEDQIIELLNGRNLSSDTLAFVLRVPNHKIIKTLNKLAKWKIVRRSTSRSINFWEVLNEQETLL